MGSSSLPNAENLNPDSQRSNLFLFPEVVKLYCACLLSLLMPQETSESPFAVIILMI